MANRFPKVLGQRTVTAAVFGSLFLAASVCEAQTPVTAAFSGPYKSGNDENGSCQPVAPTVRQTNNNGLSLSASLACGTKAKATVALTLVLSQTTITGVPTTSQAVGLSAFKLSTPLQITLTGTVTSSGTLGPPFLRLATGTSTGVGICLPQPQGASPLVYNCSPPVLDRDYLGTGPFKDYLFFQFQINIDGFTYSFNLTPQFTESIAVPTGPDQISFIDDTFSPPLNQPFQAGQPTGDVSVRVAYSLNSQASANLELYLSGPHTALVSQAFVQKGNGVEGFTLRSIDLPDTYRVTEVHAVLRPTVGLNPLTQDMRQYTAVTSQDAIKIMDPIPSAGVDAAIIGSDIAATCALQVKSGLTRYFALRIFDPDSPINALLSSTAFQKGSDGQTNRLTIPAVSVQLSGLTLGRIAVKCVLYDATQSQVVAESGSYVYAIPTLISGSPSISPSGVVDAARGGPVLSRGGLASIYGANLAGVTSKNNYVPVSTYLSGTQVSVGGIYAPVIFISQKQINFQVPFEADVSSNEAVVVSRTGLTGNRVNSNVVSVAVADYAPAVFVYGAAQDPIAVHSPSYALITAANPAKAGEVIIVFGTGVGKVSNAPQTGDTNTVFVATATITPTVTVGGSRAQVLFAGLTPGFIGLAQFNIQLPNPLPPGSSLPLVISFGSASSQPVNLAVR